MSDRVEAAAEFIWDYIHGNWGTYEDVQEMAAAMAEKGLLAPASGCPMGDVPDLWWSPKVGVVQKLDDGWRAFGGGSEGWWGFNTAEPFPDDAVQLAAQDYFAKLGRQQLDEVMVALGPLYNDERHSWNVGTLARKAAADLAGGTRTDFDSATVGALARLVLALQEDRGRPAGSS